MNSSNHPWKNSAANFLKLKAARKEAKRRYERSDKFKDWQRDNYRMKHGLDLDAPVKSKQECCEIATKARLSKLQSP